MHLPYTAAQAKAAHDDWNAMCGHYSIAAATGRPLEDIRTAGVSLKGWMNPTMISQTLAALIVPAERFLLKELGYDVPQDLVKLPQFSQGTILRVQWEGSWMNPGVPAGARYQRTHYIACKDGTIMDPAFDPAVSLRVEDWLQVVTNDIVPAIKGATGYHFTHAWIIESPLIHLPKSMSTDVILAWAAKNNPPLSKEVKDLTNEEKLALYIRAGGEVIYDDTIVRSRRMFGIHKKIDGTFHVVIEGDGAPTGTVVKFKISKPTPAHP